MSPPLLIVLFFFLGYDVKDVGVIVADVSDESSLNAMCSSADIILNCVGPVSRKKLCTLHSLLRLVFIRT